MHRRASAALRLVGRSLLALGVFLAALEVGLRLLAHFYPSPLLWVAGGAPDQVVRHWRGRPGGSFNGWPLNAQGMFDTEFALSRSPGTVRIAALGDSFGVGVVPYEDNFLTLLDEALDASQPTEVYNFSIPCLGPVDELHLYRTEVAAYEADLVLLCFFIGNDIEFRSPPESLRLGPLYSVFVARRLLALREARPDLELKDETRPTFSRDTFWKIERLRLQLALERTPDQETADWLERSYTYTAETLRELHAEVGGRLRVVLIPDEFQVDDDLRDALIAAHPDPSAFDAERPNKLLRRFL